MNFEPFHPPACPSCGGRSTAPNRMGMGQNNCKCEVCGLMFDGTPRPAWLTEAVEGGDGARIKQIYAGVPLKGLLEGSKFIGHRAKPSA